MSASTKKKLRKEQNAQVMTERQKQERAEAKKTKSITAVFLIAIALVVCIFIGTVGSTLFNSYGVMERLTTAATIGDHKINSIMMNYFFYDAVQNEYSYLQETYGEYASYFLGYDPAKPLNEQEHKESGKTWADHYMDTAIENAKAVYAVYDHAMANGFEITEEVENAIANNMMQIQWNAMLSGVSTKTVLRSIYGNGANEKSYEDYMTVKVVAATYYQQHQDSLSYDSAAIDAYEAEHFNDFSSYDFYSYYVKCDDYLTGGTLSEDGKTTTYSDAEKEAARAAAEADANSLLTATTHEELNAAIAALFNKDEAEVEDAEPEATEPEATEPETTEPEATEPEATDPEETVPTATLNSDQDHTALPEDYAAWLGAADRAANDIKVFPYSTTDADGVETVTGYYVLMYVARDDKTDLMANIRQILITPEGGTTDSNGNKTYSDEEWAAAKEKADNLLAQWKSGDANEESFKALVAENSKDTATSENGGLYEDIHEDYTALASELVKWSLDEARTANEAAVVKTSSGYHVMYYVGDDDLTYRDYMITQTLISNAMTEWEEGIISAVTATPGDDSRINKSLVLTPASK